MLNTINQGCTKSLWFSLLVWCCLFGFEVFDGSLNSIFCEHRAVKLDWRQFKVLGNILVLNLDGFLDGHSFKKLGSVRWASNGWTATKGLEHSFLNSAILLVHFDLEFHDVTAGRSSDKASTHGWVLFVERTNVAWVFVVVNDTLVVSEVSCGQSKHLSWLEHHGWHHEGWSLQHSWSLRWASLSGLERELRETIEHFWQ